MKITLYLRHQTSFGEEIFIQGDIKALHGKGDAGLPLEYTENGWCISFYTEEKNFHYSFYIQKDKHIILSEEKFSHEFGPLSKEYKTILIYDNIVSDTTTSRIFQSAVFSKVIRRHEIETKKSRNIKVPIVFKTWSTNINFNHRLSIIGNCSALGRWTESDSKEMGALTYPHFKKTLDANKLTFPLEYKYVITDPKQNTIICWEEGYNHQLPSIITPAIDLIIVNDPCPKFNLPDFKGAGTAIPIFSIRTKKSFGCGEFNDIKLLADWAAMTGQRIIQTLPINDTTVMGDWRDSYPYSAISVYALHPMYLNIEEIGALANSKEYKALQKKLNDEADVDYEAVNLHKWRFIHEQYEQYGEETFNSPEFKLFFKENQSWLKAYAVFSYLRYKHGTSEFSQWGKDAKYDTSRIEFYCDPKENKEYDDVAIHFFVQYHLHKQLCNAVQYAHSKGIALKGDIPIGVNRNSVDVWMYPTLFDREGSAGAPPDYFSKTGQIWGFPIYNWEEMAKDHYAWWKKRFQSLSCYFDAYRIDHILGFFRIFRTPTTAKMGLLGQFSPALPLSKEEIESFNIPFDKDKLTQPIINEDVLTKIFGENKSIVKEKYLEPTDNDSYRLKKDFNTHEKIDKAFGNSADQTLKTGLYYLCCQVLFIEDYKEKEKYHPRISIEQSYAYSTLNPSLQKAMKEIYEDFYYHRHNEFWKAEAMRKLTPLIESTNMMVCGEDLGMVPQCVPSVMQELEILSLEIQRMPKEMFVEFGCLSRIPRESVCTTSTHDMSTMRQWWEEDPESTQRYFSNELHQYGKAPLFCEPWICQQIIENHLNSPAIWVILPIQDWMATDGNIRWNETNKERINDPSNPNNYWKYRMHISLEELMKKEEFNERIRHMILKSNR